jgi:cyclic-di-GMP phosphodiesterase TipF (flagellum assembly factor)
MHLRERTSRYSAAVLFLAGVTGFFMITATISQQFNPDLEIWLGAALIASFLLHARAGFALNQAQREIDMLQREAKKLPKEKDTAKSKPAALMKIEFANAKDISADDASMLEQVKSAIENERVDLYLQPIVSLPQRKQRYFEAFSRLRNEDGSILRPAAYLNAAERANRIGAIDNLILLRSVQALRNFGPEAQHHRIFCNISPATLFDDDFFARFTDYLDANADLAPRLVFEFTYPAVEMMCGTVEKNLDAIARRGYAFSVDHVRRFDLNWKKLRERNFRYVKCSSAMLLAENNGGDQARLRVKGFRQRLQEHNIDLIVEKVEFESHVPEILTLGIDYGQGELFGAPRPAAFYLETKLELAAAS